MISIIILAAGKSERMGKTKQLMRLREKSILERTIESYIRSGVDGEVIVVLGYRADEIRENIRKYISNQTVRIVDNPDYERGMSTSIVAGVRAISGDTDAVMIAMGDQPFINGLTVNKLAKEFQRHDKGIIVPGFEGKRGQPVIFSLKYKNDLLSLTGDIGARNVVQQHSADVLEVPVSDDGVLFDIDTENDYLNVINKKLK